MEEEASTQRESRLDAWGRDDFSVYKMRKGEASMEIQVHTFFKSQLSSTCPLTFLTLQETVTREVIDGVLPFFREKPKDVALSEGEPLQLSCLVASEPKAAIHWLKNDLIFMEDSR